MGKIKIPIGLRFWLSQIDLKALLTFQRILSLVVLGFFAFFISSPTTLAYFELVPLTQALSLNGALSGAVSSFFGAGGEILQKFSTQSDALISKAAASGKTQFDLVAILVDESLANDTTAYDGLISSHNAVVPADANQAYRKLTDQTLMNRIERYAKDIQGINKVVDPQPFLKTAIIKVKRNEPTQDIASALEKLYREGDGTIGETNHLKGIVIVGQVPLPVVNKDGNRFVSLFPYTDFDDPYYIFDAKSKDFIKNPSNQKAGAEVWNGVIVPPVDGEDGNKLLAEYFDKNHLFKIGEPEYKDFAQKMFYSDMNKEYRLLGSDGLPAYYQYLKYWEDISYLRWNKHWAEKLYNESSAQTDALIGAGNPAATGCTGECSAYAHDLSIDSDSDGYPDGYEKDYGSISVSVLGFPKFLAAAVGGTIKEDYKGQEEPTDPQDPDSVPSIHLETPLFTISFPRHSPEPDPNEWIGKNGIPMEDKAAAAKDPGAGGGSPSGPTSTGMFANLPDIRSMDIIMNFFKKYDELFNKFYADVNDWTNGTGRYDASYQDANKKNLTDLVTFPYLIAIKDEATRLYLKAVNDAIEARVDDYVRKREYDIRMLRGAVLSGYVILDDNPLFPPKPHTKVVFNDVNFINFGYKNDAFFAGIEAIMTLLKTLDPALADKAQQDFLDTLKKMPLSIATPTYINGKPIESITNIDQCSMYRGSEGGENSQMVTTNSVNDPNSNINKEAPPQMPPEWNSMPSDILTGVDGNDYKGLYWWWNKDDANPPTSPLVQWMEKQRKLNASYAGCFAVNSRHPERCFVPLATRFIFSLNGGQEVKGVPEAAVSHQACFDLKAKNGFDAYALNSYLYLKALLMTPSEEDKAKLDKTRPDPASAYSAPKDINLLSFLINPPKFYEDAPGLLTMIDLKDLVLTLADPKLAALSINFEQILKAYMAGNRVDDNGDGVVDDPAEADIQFFPINDSDNQPNWFQVGEQLLQNPRVDENAADPKDRPLKFGPGIIPGTQEVYIRILPLLGQTISSLVFHKEPTADTFEAQTYELERDANGDFLPNTSPVYDDKGNYVGEGPMTDGDKQVLGQYKAVTKTAPDGTQTPVQTRDAMSIPLDSPRYVSFRDANGNYQKIVYPNAFKAKDLNELKQQLTDMEAQLKAIPVNPIHADVGPDTVDGYLSAVISPQDVANNGGISQAGEQKLTDALNWKGMDLDQKHQYSLLSYWGSAYTPFTPLSESPKGYEVLYMNSAGDDSSMAMKFNKDFPASVPVERIDCALPENGNLVACKPAPVAPAPVAGQQEQAVAPADKDNSIFILEWFAAMVQWAKDTADIAKGKGAVTSCPSGGFTDMPDDPGYGQPYKPNVVVQKPVDLDGNGIPDQADNTTKLSIALGSSSKNVLKAGVGDQVDVIVQALDKSGKINLADSNNSVQLTLTNLVGTGKIVEIVGPDTMTFAMGEAKFRVMSGDMAGTVNLQGGLAKKAEVKSEAIPLSVTKEEIKLLAFRRYNTYSFTQGATGGMAVFDGSHNQIAAVDPLTGYINILNADYELKVLPASGVKPLRQAVVSKKDGKVMSILYFVVGGDKEVKLDTADTDYAAKYKDLAGVHIKDLSGTDSLNLQKVSDSTPMNGGMLLVDSKVSENLGRVGFLDKKGNLFTSLKVHVKSGLTDGPVIFVVEDSSGLPAMELYVGAKFSEIKILPFDQLKDFFAALPGAMEVVRIARDNAVVVGWMEAVKMAHAADLAAGANGQTAAGATGTAADTTGVAGKTAVGQTTAAAGSPAIDQAGVVAAAGVVSKTPVKAADLKTVIKPAMGLPDADKDGLNDLEELIIGTDPNNPDTNGDGINDLDSINRGIDPKAKGNKPLFADMKVGDYGFAEMVKLLRRGIVVAGADGSVRPADSITREEFVKLDLGGICVICDRFAESVKKSVWTVYQQNPFPDLDVSNDYKYCVAEGKNRGIISGYKAFANVGYYVPKANISRAEATKVILETARQQIQSFPSFVANENIAGKPWYYNYVLTAQKEGIYPKGRFEAIDRLNNSQFQGFFDAELAKANSGLPGGIDNSQFMLWLAQPITRVDFAVMVAQFVDKYNCGNIDSDGDGLPDNFEKYIYGTNPNDPDTDHGGVPDGVEVLRGSNPLDASDDYPKPKVDLNADPDKDGLTTGREQDQTKTDPYNPDTDAGGVQDGMEVLVGTDPLNQGDDKDFGKGSGLEDQNVDGAYMAGIEVGPKTVYTLPGDGTGDTGINTEETDRIPADGVSQLYIKASIYDENGVLRRDDSSSIVRFAFKNPGDGDSAVLDPTDVQVTNGMAETTITSKTKTGLPVVIATVDGKEIPSDEQLIEVYALEPAKAEITAVSPIIPSGGKSTTELKAVLKDQNGNLANSGSYTATFSVEAGGAAATILAARRESPVAADQAVLDDSEDVDSATAGVQLSSVTGEYALNLKSGINPDLVKVKISYTGPVQEITNNPNDTVAQLLKVGTQLFKPADVTAETTVETRNDLQVIMKPDKTELKSDRNDETQVVATVTDAGGNVLDGFVGEITVKLVDPKIGVLVDPSGGTGISITVPLEKGLAQFKVRSTLKAGDLEVLGTVEGIPAATIKLVSYAYLPAAIVLDSTDLQVDTDPSKTYTVTAKLYDTAGNFVNRDNSTAITFSMGDESQTIANLVSPATVIAKNGMASASFQTGSLTGPVHLVANSKDLIDGDIQINAVHNFSGKEFRTMKPKFLYADLLGAGYGAVTQADYLGGWFVFSGKVESAASLITDPKPKMRLAEVMTSGKVNVGNDDIAVQLIPTGSDNAVVKQVVNENAADKQVMEVSIVPKTQSKAKLVISVDDVDRTAETINVVNLVDQNTDYNFDTDGDNINIMRKGQLVAVIGNDARIKLLSPLLQLVAVPDDKASEPDWLITDSGNEIANVIVSVGNLGDVVLLDDKTAVPATPGIYIKKLSTLPQRSYIQSFSGNSTAAPKGYFYTDDSKPLDKGKSPGLDYLSLESSADDDGVGLRGDNKNVLLFAAGNTVGEANLPYASDAGVVLGDPTVRIDNKKNADPADPNKIPAIHETGFTNDVGKLIFAGNKPIKEVVAIDYDNDGDKDIMTAYESGEVKLIENVNNGKEFVDRGTFMNFPTGILSMTAMDINNDGWEDLVVATADSCKVGEVCVDAYLNDHGNFVRTNLGLEGYSAKNKVYMIKSADMNQDGFPDLVVSDDTGAIKVFYTKDGQIDKQGHLIGNLGVKINQANNYKEEVFANYDGMVGMPDGSTDNKNYENVVVPGDTAASDRKLVIKSIGIDDNLKISSTKKAKDMTEPFDVLAEGDLIQYTVTLVNSGSYALNNLLVGDIAPENASLDKTSINCTDCKDKISLIESGQSLRPVLISGIDMPAKSSRTITYNVSVNKLPKVKFIIGQNLTSEYPVHDNYPDIAATPENNPTGKMVYYYSVTKDADSGRVNYATYVTPDPKIAAPKSYEQPKDAQGKPLGVDLHLFDQKNADGIPVAVQYFMDYGTLPNVNLDGAAGGSSSVSDDGGNEIPGLPGVGAGLDKLGKGLDKAADSIAGALGGLTCSGGCIPMPINWSFLTPGVGNVMGLPVGGFDPGLPIFGWGGPSLIPIWPVFLPYQATVGGRIYLSPTLTLKIAMSVCLGPYLIGFGPFPGNCWTIVLPIDPFAAICKAINGAIDKALAGANSLASSISGTIGSSSDGGMADTPTKDGKNYTGGFEASNSMGNYGFKVNAHTNFRIPTFPAFIVKWLDDQTAEIITKLTDLPDIYILLPDVTTVFKSNSSGTDPATMAAKALTAGSTNVAVEPVSPTGLRGVLTAINKIPIIQIVPQEVLLMIPSLTPGEIDRFINDAKQWVQDEKAELERAMNIWRCGPWKEKVPDPNGGSNADGTPKTVAGYVDASGATVLGDRPYAKICDILTVDMTKLFDSVEKNIDTINSYKEFPRQVLGWRNMLTKYVTQVICYIDAIVQFFVGTISKWMSQALGWVNAVAVIIETIASWKLLIDLVLNYQADCDSCTSARFSLLELILKLFAFIPSPPIIPFPKLPDIYLDFSQIQFGIKILWPDIKFRPAPIMLPSLPRILLPDLPMFKITLPAIPILPPLPKLPELPDLPPLTLPAVPDLPPPPKIPALPGAIKIVINILKKIFLILCLIKKGLIPTPEFALKTVVEHMTERGLDPLLPFDLGLALQWPTINYDYLDRIVVTLKINLHPDFTVIYDLVQMIADKINMVSAIITNAANAATAGINAGLAAGANAANAGMAGAVPKGGEVVVPGAKAAYIPASGPGSLEDFIKQFLIKPETINGVSANTPIDGSVDSVTEALNKHPDLPNLMAELSPQLSQTIIELADASKGLETTRKDFATLAAGQEYKDIHLTAGTMTIKATDAAANKSIEELDKFDLNSTLMALGPEFADTQKLAGLRQNLLAFVKENKALDSRAMATSDLSQFATLMAQAPSVSDVLIKSGYSSGETMMAQGSMMAGVKQLFAKTETLDDIIKNSGLPPDVQGTPVAKGMFIYNEAAKQNEKLINYQDELSQPNTMNFVDTNGDGVDDLVYSLGSNVYFKENYKKAAKIGTFYGGMPKYYNLEDMVPAAPAVSGFTSSFSGNKTLDLKWNKAGGADVTGYEVLVGPRLGGVSYAGVSNNLNSDGMQKYVYLNSADSTGSLLTNSLLQPAGDNYDFPVSTLYEIVAAEITGEVDFDGPQQTLLAAGGGKVPVIAGEEVYAGQDSVVSVWFDGVQKADKKMAARELITMPDSFSGDLQIQVKEGGLTMIDPSKTVAKQTLVPGSKIELNSKYQSVNGGSALIKLPAEAYTRVDSGQSMEIEVLDNPDLPAATLQLANGFYFAVIRSFEKAGFRSLISESTLLWPNICSDRQVPFPVAGPSDRKVAIFKTLEVDASNSFDPVGGKIVSYYIDTDLKVDSDGDGDPTNDKNLGRDINPEVDSDGNGVTYDDLDDPKLFLGPYQDLNDHEVMLNVVDESGNLGQQKLTIHVYVPAITLDDSTANLTIGKDGNGGTVSGSLDSAEAKMPIALLRDRDGVSEPIVTKAADSNGKYYTDAAGKFAVTDLNLKDTVTIKDGSGRVIATIDPKTGRIVLTDPTYSIEPIPAQDPLLPTRVVVKDAKGLIMTTLFIVSDANTDVTMDGLDVKYTATSVPLLKGVHWQTIADAAAISDFEIRQIAGDDKKYAGGVEMIDKSNLKRLMVLDSGGNFYTFDPRIKLALKDVTSLEDPMIFKVMLQKADGTAVEVAEFYVSFKSQKPITILDPNKFKLFVGDPSLHGPQYDYDKDGMSDIWERQYGLDPTNPADAKEDPDHDGLTNLEEYWAGSNPLVADSNGDGVPDGMSLSMGLDPVKKPTSPFIDVLENNPYYEAILNFYHRGILAGIPAGNQLRFGFDEPITRAEFAKVILDTFCIVPRPEAYLSPGVFSDIPFVDGQLPWYFPATKEAYFQGFITGYKGLIDKLTGRTPFAPDETISKAEAVKVILETLAHQGTINMGAIPVTEPYYLPYLTIAENLTPYLVKGKTAKDNFILTADEAADPEAPIKRGEFIKLADRVLTAFDCSTIDDDQDGMPTFWEKKHGLNPYDPKDAALDPDGDGLTNLMEYKFGTDPHNPDTDGGGVKDGVEVLKRHSNPLDPKDDFVDSDGDGLSDNDEVNKYHTDPHNPDTDGGGVNDGEEVLVKGTNPLNPLDDKDSDGDGLGDWEETQIYHTDPHNPDTDGGGVWDGVEVYRGTDPLNPIDDIVDPRKDLGPGVYVIPSPCTSCPCPSAISHTADLIPGDKILGVISNKDNSQIFSQSNLEVVTTVVDNSNSGP